MPWTYLALFVVLLGCVGCGSDGTARYELAGKITFGGQPVPKGYLRFAPDKEAGNSGPGASATIIDGSYTTLAGQGTVGGPHVVKIVGTDGVPYKNEGITIPVGRPLFPEYEVRVDLPKQSGTHDFEVPADHGQGKPARRGG